MFLKWLSLKLGEKDGEKENKRTEKRKNTCFQ